MEYCSVMVCPFINGQYVSCNECPYSLEEEVENVRDIPDNKGADANRRLICPMCGRDLVQAPVKDKKTDKGLDILAVYRCMRCKCDRVIMVADKGGVQ